MKTDHSHFCASALYPHVAKQQPSCTIPPALTLQWHPPRQHLLPSIACASVQSSSHNGLHTANVRSCAAASAPQHFVLTSKSSNPVLQHHLPCHCRGANPSIYCKSMLVLMHKPLSQQPSLGHRNCGATLLIKRLSMGNLFLFPACVCTSSLQCIECIIIPYETGEPALPPPWVGCFYRGS